MNTRTPARAAAGLALAVLAFTVEALYWPILLKPGTVLGWWQVKWAADIGYFIGPPAVIAAATSPFRGATGRLYVWICALAWALIVFACARFVLGRISEASGRSRR
jgi:hypothetical protein